MKKKIIKVVCFCLCVLAVMSFLSEVFHYDKSHMRHRLHTYTQIAENSVDAVAVGTSGIHCFWIPGQAYNDYGMTMYNVTINGMQVWHILPMIKYAYKYQNPKLVVVDMRPFTVTDSTKDMEYRSRYFNELLPMWSPLRFETTNRTLKYMSKMTDTSRFDLSYYFCVLRYHDMWQDGLTFNVLNDKYTMTYGYLMSDRINVKKPVPVSEFTDEKEDIAWFAKECLDELVEYAEKKNIELCFVNTPHYVKKEIMVRNNMLKSYLDELGIKYYDCTTEENAAMYDNENDFFDKNHMNYYGATKFTDNFAKFLLENFDFPDRRQDESCNQWMVDYEKTLKRAVKSYDVDIGERAKLIESK